MQIKGLMITTLVGACFAISPAIAQDASDMGDAAVEQVTEVATDMATDAAQDVAAEAQAAVVEQAADMVPEAAQAAEVEVPADVTPPALEGMDAVVTEVSEAVSTEAAEMVDAVEAVVTETAPAGPEGMWTRDNGNQVKVEFRGDAMYCTIINRTKRNGKPKKDFEMCHGMTADGETWTGRKMKHPEMPGFMTFKGTVSMADDVISIKGCAVGVCDSESWTRMAAES